MSICVVALLAALPLLAARNITENVTLDADADWSADGTVTIAEGVTVNLNGHVLKVKGLECNGSIIDEIPGYTQIAYIESSGTQWINTGFVTTADTAIECDFTTLNNNNNRALFCGDWASYGHLFVLNTNGMNFFGTGNKLSNFVAYKHFRIQTIPGGSKTVILYDGDTGAEVGFSDIALTHTGTGEMTLFAANADGSHPALCRIHAFKLTHAGTVVRDMVPVKRTVDGAIGLYDFSTEAFFANGGSGTFIAGDVMDGKLVIDISDGAAYAVAGSCEVPVSVRGTLSDDVDLRCFGERLEFNDPVYLSGHQLTVATFSGTGEIANIPGEFIGLEDNGTAGIFRVDLPNGAHVENTVATIAGKVCFVKAGAGEYVERVAQENTGGVTLEGGTLSWEQDTPAVKGPLTLAGGTLVIADGKPISAMDGVSVTAPSTIAFRRDVKFGPRAAILNFGSETPLGQLSLTVTPNPACETSLARAGNDLQVVLGDANDVVDAVWTGTADNVVSNPANWFCTNPAGVQIANGLPSRMTTVHIAGTVAMQCPADSDFACAEVILGDCTLATDCDWRGLGVLPVSGTIDLAGHKLYTTGVSGDGTVTSGGANGYRYYRFKVDATGGNDFQISVVELRYGAVLLSGRQKAIHWREDNFPSNFVTGYNPEKAFDGNTATKWYDNRSKDDIWATLEYEEPVMLTVYRWFTANDTKNAPTRNPTAWRLQASTDNATWTDLEVVTGATPTSDNKTLAYTGYVNTNPGGDGSELHIEVAEGTCQTNSTVTFAGRLKLVKDGTGVLVLSKSGQTYGGGTLVAAGTLKPGLSLNDDVSIFGAANSTMTVAEGAQFLDDVYGLGEMSYLDWVIAGSGPDGTGAIRATARTPGRNNAEVAWGRSLTLMGDATIGSNEYAFDFIAPNYITFPVTLNGHALTLKSAKPMNERQYPFFLASSLKGTDAGTIVVGDNLCFYPFKLDASALPEVTLVVSANAEYRTGTDSNARDLTVSNLVYRSESTISQTAHLTTVLGTYTPTSTTSAPKVQLGDAEHLSVGLDLSERTTEFDVAFGGGFTFTEGACVKVNLGTRRRRQSERLVAWTEKPVGVTFTGETLRDRFIVRDDGLYAVRGTMIIIR